MNTPQRILIMGAAGRDFHNFNTAFRGNSAYNVVGFTATQIPGIEGRTYPAELAGPGYPDGIRIYDEANLVSLIRDLAVDQVVFAYSDVPHEYVMHKASTVLATGADFRLMGPNATQIKGVKPIVSIGAVRTGSGKSQTTRHVAAALKALGLRVAVIRHPMPYGDLTKQAVQRFATYADLDLHHCTIEEREEYEPHIDAGHLVFAGVDYERILRAAEAEADVVVWDGGNNDLPFYASNLHIVVADPHRPGHEAAYHPGEANVRMANIVIINKVDTADYKSIVAVRERVAAMNPTATILEAASPLFVDNAAAVRGKRVLVVEDGPTLTHGEMPYGAGVVAAKRLGAASLIDPRPFAVGSIAAVYTKYPHMGALLPAMGYGDQQMAELEATINASDADLVLAATPIDLRRVVKVRLPIERVRYELQVIGTPTLAELLAERFEQAQRA